MFFIIMEIQCEMCGTPKCEVTNYLCNINCCDYYLCNKCSSDIFMDMVMTNKARSCHKCGDKHNFMACIDLTYCLSTMISVANYIIRKEDYKWNKIKYIEDNIKSTMKRIQQMHSTENKQILRESLNEQIERIRKDIIEKKDRFPMKYMLKYIQVFLQYKTLFMI